MIGIIGLNHETAPLDIRGQLSFGVEEIKSFYNYINESFEELEAVLLCTCNRTELYFSLNKSCGHGYGEQMITHLLDFKGITERDKFDFYKYIDTGAVKHLFKVSSGLNSMVLGENQILGQLKEAYRISIENKMSRSIMSRLFHKAFQSGKRVRNETHINKGASSVSYAAVELTHQVFSSLDNHSVLLIGAGEAGDLVLQSLKERGSNHISIMNRTFSRAEVLAEKYSAQALSLDKLDETLLKSDIVITSTASTTPIIWEAMISDLMKKRKNKMLLLIDLSVPRNIEESIRSIKDVFLFNLDDLQEVVAFNYSKRQGAIKKANVIIDEIVEEFNNWLSGLTLSPTIDQLKSKLSTIIDGEINSFQGNLTPGELVCLEKFSSKINKKYLSMIIKNLKILSNNGKHVEYIDLVNNLFDLQVAERKPMGLEIKVGE